MNILIIISAFYKKQKKYDILNNIYLTILFSLVFGGSDRYIKYNI
jgi:hypothetical protein